MEPVPVRAIPVEEVGPADVDADAAEAAVVGTARFAMWVGGMFAATCAAMIPGYYVLMRNIAAVNSKLVVLELVFLVVQAVGGLVLMVGGFGAKRSRAANALMSTGALAIIAAYLAGFVVTVLATFVQRRMMGANALILFGGWLNQFEAMLAPLGALLLAYGVKRVMRAQRFR